LAEICAAEGKHHPYRSSERARSESPSPVLKAKGTTFRAASSSPVGMRLSRMPRLKPWRGPLPRRRITPAPVVGYFIAQAVSRMLMATATENVARSSPPAGDLGSWAGVRSRDRRRPRCGRRPRRRRRGAGFSASKFLLTRLGRRVLGPSWAGPSWPSNEAFLRCRPS
jgi:hypothetical protein